MAQAALRSMNGAAVWRDMSQAELDAAYDQIKYAPNQPQILKRFASNSEACRERCGAPERVAYGSTPIESLDLYSSRVATPPAGAPINVFVHGGAWRSGCARDYGFLAEMFVHAGAHFVVPDFAWAQDVDGSLQPVAAQVRRALAWVYSHSEELGGDPERIYVSGHSSGAHLAAVLLATDWQKGFGLPADVIKGGLCCSGIYELKPVSLSSRSSYLKITADVEQTLSPHRNLAQVHAPLLLAYGSLETPEFKRQSVDFHAALRQAGKPVQLMLAEGYNHFEILETLASPYGLLGRAALAQMRLGES
ncbi:MAG: alpha/beta hydrolase [Burkholderiaceae bacterium]